MGQSILITGATGTIGPRVVYALDQAGFRLRSFSVDTPAEGMFPQSVEVLIGDVTNQVAVQTAMQNVDAVVHLAARNHVLKETARDPLAEYHRVNVEGTRNVIRAASSSGVKYFVHLSSVKAMGEESESILDEERPCAPKTPYGISKLESEEAVREGATRTGMLAVILRLPMVYGPRNKGNISRMIRWADKGLPFPFFQPDNLRSMVYVENVVAGIMAVFKNQLDGVPTYIVKDKEDYSTRTVYTAICREFGKKPRFLPIPASAVRLGGWFSEDFRKVAGSFRVSSARIEKEIGFFPPYSLEEGIARTVRWYKDSAR